MALKKCKECGNGVSSKAKSCPSCGAPIKKRSRILRLFFGLVIILIIVVYISSTGDNYKTQKSERSSSKNKVTTKPEPNQDQKNNDYTGIRYCVKSALEEIVTKDENGKVVNTAKGIKSVNIRTGPGMNYADDKTGPLMGNDSLYVLDEQKGWIKFRVTEDDLGWSAWVPKKLTESVSEINTQREAKFGKCPSRSCVKDYLKSIVNDPDSLKFEDWSDIYFNEKDGWIVLCKYRGKNTFGAYVLNVNWFVIQHGRVVDVKEPDSYK